MAEEALTVGRIYGLFLSLKDASEYELSFYGNGSGRLQHIKSERAQSWKTLDEAETILHGMVGEQYGEE